MTDKHEKTMAMIAETKVNLGIFDRKYKICAFDAKFARFGTQVTRAGLLGAAVVLAGTAAGPAVVLGSVSLALGSAGLAEYLRKYTNIEHIAAKTVLDMQPTKLRELFVKAAYDNDIDTLRELEKVNQQPKVKEVMEHAVLTKWAFGEAFMASVKMRNVEAVDYLMDLARRHKREDDLIKPELASAMLVPYRTLFEELDTAQDGISDKDRDIFVKVGRLLLQQDAQETMSRLLIHDAGRVHHSSYAKDEQAHAVIHTIQYQVADYAHTNALRSRVPKPAFM